MGGSDKVDLRVSCPGCQNTFQLSVPEGRSITFVVSCPSCRTHIQFEGTAGDYRLEDLKATNAEFTCPECGGKSPVWVSPDRAVRFLKKCQNCEKFVQIVSDGHGISTEKVGPATK